MCFFSSSTMDNPVLRLSLRSTDCATFFKRARGTTSFVRLFSSITPNGLLYSLYRFPAFPQGPEFIEGQPHLTESFLYAMIITAHKEEKMPTLRARIRRALRLVIRFLGQVLVGLARGTALIIRDIHRFLYRRMGARVWVGYLFVAVISVLGQSGQLEQTLGTAGAYAVEIANQLLVLTVMLAVLVFWGRLVFGLGRRRNPRP